MKQDRPEENGAHEPKVEDDTSNSKEEEESTVSSAARPVVSFSFGKKKSAPQKIAIQTPQPEEKKDYVTKVEGSEIHSLDGPQTDEPLVIPLIGPQTQLPKKNTTKQAVAAPTELFSQLSGEDKEAAEKLLEQAKKDPEDLPLLLRNRLPGLDDIEDEEARFKFDVSSRPDESTVEAYQKIPVNKFGEAALRGMGWSPGQPIGLSNPAVVKPVEFTPRNHRLGLGATPEELATKKEEKKKKKKKKKSKKS